MPKTTLRYQRVSDAKRFYEILNNPNFIYFNAKPKNVDDEKKWLKENQKRRKNNTAWNYTVLYDNQIVGAIGIKINSHKNYIGEVGCFLDEKFWGKGIITKAVKLVEKEGFDKLGLKRLEMIMEPRHKASEKVAIKCGYKKEGLLKKALKCANDEMKDVLMYAKIK